MMMVQKKLGSMSRSNSIWLSRSKQDRPIVVKRLEIVEFQAFKSTCTVDILPILLQYQIHSSCRGAIVGNAGKPWLYLDLD